MAFINKNQRLTYDLKYSIRVVCMEDFEQITNMIDAQLFGLFAGTENKSL